MTTKAEFYDMLQQHDWFYEFSEDRNVYTRGSCTRRYLINIANQDAEFKKLYYAYHAYIFKNGVKPQKEED